MKAIREQIAKRSFCPVYLLYGEEAYLRQLWKNKLKEGILNGDEGLNYAAFVGKQTDTARILQAAQTLPFLSEYRLVLIEESGLFQTQSDLADALPQLPESTVLLFVETQVDKRNRLYKAVKARGEVCELNAMNERELKLFVVSELSKADKQITETTAAFLVARVGTEMLRLRTELDKLVAYTYGRAVVTETDIGAICTELPDAKLYQLTEALGKRDLRRAIEQYQVLLSMREHPMVILFSILRHFNTLLQVKLLVAGGAGKQEITERLGLRPFLTDRYLSQARGFSKEALRQAIAYGIDLEEQVKTGNLNEKISVEFLIVKLNEM